MPELTERNLPQRTSIMVAVYWPGEGYGGATTYETMEQARDGVAELVRLGYGQAGKYPIHIITKMTDAIEFVLPETPKPTPAPKPHGRTKGWAHHNPDTGWEWSKNHPVESGECPDATEIEAMSLTEFRRRHPVDA